MSVLHLGAAKASQSISGSPDGRDSSELQTRIQKLLETMKERFLTMMTRLHL